MISLQGQPGSPRQHPSRLRNGVADPLLVRLSHFTDLSNDDQAALSRLGNREISVGNHTDLARDGEATASAFLILEGIACRYAQTASGHRQLLNLLLPGDICDPDLIHLERWDHSVATLSPCRVVQVSRVALEDLILTHLAVNIALRRAKLEAEARSRSWLTALGVYSAPERLARLFFEVIDRLHAVGLAERNACSLPLTQVDLAECIGVTTVHVNRILRELRKLGLLELKGGQLRIWDRDGLKVFMGA